jgi:hypothetical protein
MEASLEPYQYINREGPRGEGMSISNLVYVFRPFDVQ